MEDGLKKFRFGFLYLLIFCLCYVVHLSGPVPKEAGAADSKVQCPIVVKKKLTLAEELKRVRDKERPAIFKNLSSLKGS